MAKRKRTLNEKTSYGVQDVADSQPVALNESHYWDRKWVVRWASDYLLAIQPKPLLKSLLFSRLVVSDISSDPNKFLDVEAALSRANNPQHIVDQMQAVEERVSALEFYQLHSIRPALGRLVRHMEMYGERDLVPPAASAEYEWHLQVANADDIVGKMLDKFDELEERLSFYVKLLDQIQQLWKLARTLGNRHLRDATLILHDGLAGIYSEDLTIQQAKVIEDAVRQLKDLDWDREMVRALDRSLRGSGFETVPSDKFVVQQNERERTYRRNPVS